MAGRNFGDIFSEEILWRFLIIKAKKIIAGICASTICSSALVLSANAASSFSNRVNNVPVSGSISISKTMALATASIGDDPTRYEIAQVQINMDYKIRNNTDGYEALRHKSSKCNTGGNRCNAPHPEGYTIVSANAQNNFNINGVIGSFDNDV